MDNSEKQTLYEKYGGAETIKKIVDDLNGIMLKDDRVKHFFEGVDINILDKHQGNFVSKVLGGPVFEGTKSLRDGHAHLNLEDEHFDVFVESLTDVLDKVGFEKADISGIVAGMEHARDEVLNR